jgi:hypothetical protein
MVAMALVGCREVTINDGRVPAEYLTQAKQLEGHYKGSFDGKRAEIEIYFEGDRPFIRYTDSRGNDPLDANCNSKIDLLQSIVLFKKRGEYVLDQAIFGFHPGSCRIVKGRTFTLDFSGSQKFTASIYEDSEYVQRCTPNNPPNRGSNCHTEEIPYYISGKFSR